jgi:hypothetical protein
VVRTTHDPDHLDWVPLERFCATAARHGIRLRADEFMWMGRCELDGGAVVHLYKHADTRRYLNLDTAGHTYRYLSTEAAAAYEPIPSPAAAVAHVLYRGENRACLAVARWSTPATTTPSPSPGRSL